MIIKNKNLVLGLIFVMLIGLFSPVIKITAQTLPTCTPGQTTSCVQAPTDTSTYKFLAPLPCDNGTPGCPGGKLTTFDAGSNSNKLGEYLNIMIRIFIGICAVLSVVMIVVGGIEWMTSELISSKEAGKEKIRNALFGLLIALGAYALLNTINPDLLISDLKLPTATATVFQEERDSGPPTVTAYTGALPSGAAPGCAQGVVRTSSGIVACGSISSNIDQMIAAAKAAGVDLSGGGYRTPEQQTALRIANCNGDVSNQNAICKPPTAVPGRSMHQGGLAFDMTCSGVVIQSASNACFVWLQANASKYGLQNYAAEPWHWSTNGK
ncbi:MAG TPA: D-alanyl-D-alanine carboxypeptidase family protein [Candidatus Paceibacterota bacterium]|jgi:hypothetical protein|nr:D-alanyl-D-alanine carboxypeptidase family protein [Candidatus Paceibacterota bacterium]